MAYHPIRMPVLYSSPSAGARVLPLSCRCRRYQADLTDPCMGRNPGGCGAALPRHAPFPSPDQRSFPWETAEPKIHPGKDDSPHGCSHFPRCNSGADHKSNGGNASNFPINPGGQIKNRFHPGLQVRRKRST